jgi:hypothetical protein
MSVPQLPAEGKSIDTVIRQLSFQDDWLTSQASSTFATPREDLPAEKTQST